MVAGRHGTQNRGRPIMAEPRERSKWMFTRNFEDELQRLIGKYSGDLSHGAIIAILDERIEEEGKALTNTGDGAGDRQKLGHCPPTGAVALRRWKKAMSKNMITDDREELINELKDELEQDMQQVILYYAGRLSWQAIADIMQRTTNLMVNIHQVVEKTPRPFAFDQKSRGRGPGQGRKARHARKLRRR